eukprot:jgi/Galph1/4199/GphlegSOOS_G2819.1
MIIPQGFSADYFVVNGVEVRSSIILLPHTGYLWRPQNFAQITSDSFTIFRLLQPKLGKNLSYLIVLDLENNLSIFFTDTLIIGGGRSAPHLSKELYQEIASICQGFELLKTHDACSLFNVLNEEGRQVGAALIRAEL